VDLEETTVDQKESERILELTVICLCFKDFAIRDDDNLFMT